MWATRQVTALYQQHALLPRAPPGQPALTCPPPGGTPCICSSGAGAGRCSPPRTPCIGSRGACAGRCSPPRALLALAPFALVLADARPPALFACAPEALVLADARAPAFLVFAPALMLADAGRCSPPHSLHVLLRRWCGQKLNGFFIFAAPAPAGSASSRLQRLRLLLPTRAVSSATARCVLSPSSSSPPATPPAARRRLPWPVKGYM